MLKNYFKTAWRNLLRNKTFSSINIFGLALGMACSLLIFLWVQDERSVDNFHNKRLYSVYERSFYDGKVEADYGTPGPLPDELKRQIPEVETAGSYSWDLTHTFSVGDKAIKENGNAASADFFRLFNYSLIEGNPTDALSRPESIAISKKMATEFFGSPTAAMGKTLRYEDKQELKVSAVFDDLPANASTHFNFLLDWEAFKTENTWLKTWSANAPRTYILLRPDADAGFVERKIAHFIDHYKQPSKGYRLELGLQPFDEGYLHATFKAGRPAGGRIEYVYIFSLVAVFILLIACINFINLTTARSMKRAKEIGVRKVVGAARSLLVRQFIGEAVMVAVFSMGLALLIAALVLPYFNQLSGKQMTLRYNRGTFWLTLSGLALATGIISGIYPSFLLSRFSPVTVLKGGGISPGDRMGRGNGAVWLRKGLVVFQFTLSIVLIISTLLISRQIRYIQNTHLGYDRDNLVYIPAEGKLKDQMDVFTREAQHLRGVSMVTEMSESPTEIVVGTTFINWPGKSPDTRPRFAHAYVGYDFIKTLHLKLAEGRDYSKQFALDSVGYIVNESALDKIGYKDPIGKPLTLWNHPGRIIGVVKDFHFQSLHEAIQPLILSLGQPTDFYNIIVRIRPGQTQDALADLGQLCKQLNPKFPFNYKFSDEEYNRLYKSEQTIGHIAVIFAALAIFISCLGLLGLSIFTVYQRTKEISIRKILGASVTALFGLLSGEFLALVGIAFVIAIPVAWWATNQWLQQFAYRTPVAWWLFGIAGALAALIVLATVGLQAIRAVKANPIRALRSE